MVLRRTLESHRSSLLIGMGHMNKYSDVTFGVRNKATGYEKPVHTDTCGMKRRFRREDMDRLQEDKQDQVETVEVGERSGDGGQDIFEEDELFFDAVDHVEEPAEIELGRGRRQKRQPAKLLDYVL